MKKIKAWGGFSDGHIAEWEGMQYGYDAPAKLRAIFFSRREARKRFEDVRPVTFIYSIPPRKTKPKK